MNARILMIVLLLPFGAFAADEPGKPPADNSAGATQQAATPQAAAPQQAADPYIDFNKRVQERLTVLGFYTGPINGDIGPNSQAALAQFQLSVPIPASGALDDQTVAALGLERSVQASAGASTDSSPGTAPAQQQPADEAGAKPSAESSPPNREQGGSVEANANAEASSGASRPAEVKGN